MREQTENRGSMYVKPGKEYRIPKTYQLFKNSKK